MIKLNEMTVLDQKVRLSDEPLFSFIYDGKNSKDFLKTWEMRKIGTYEKVDGKQSNK